MPYALVIFGLIMVVTAAKGTHVALGNQLVKDFSGPGNFIYWILAIIVLGVISKTPQGEKLAKPFLILVLVAMLVSNKGFFAQFMAAIKSGPQASQRETLAATPSATTTAGNSASTDLGSLAKTAMNVAALIA